MKAGRPLRFLAVTLGGWTAMRVVMLWPVAAPLMASDARPSSLRPPVQGTVLAALASVIAGSPAKAATLPPILAIGPPAGRRRDPPADEGVQLSPATVVKAGTAHGTGRAMRPFLSATEGTIPPPLRPAPLATGPSRLAGSAWLIARGGANGTLTGGQLGGSQAGVRLTYALGTARRVALAARVSTPLQGHGRELGLGVEWQPTRLPLRLVAEQRVALDGGRGGPTVMAIGGFGPADIAPGFRLEAYGQAGVIARNGAEAFGDGAARLTHQVASLGPVKLDAGAGTWAAGQRGATRLDVGPTIGLVIPVAKRAVRLTLDWRERVAGDARPGSGPALSIGSDF